MLFCALLFAGLAAYAQPQARFSASTTSACAPVLVQFTDESTGNPNYWKWDLGDGTISYLKNPSATYLHPGIYTIKLLVQNSAGEDSLIKTNYVEVHAAPAVSFTASQTSACSQLSTNFTAQGNGSQQWQWDFGDGIFSTEQNPAHTYAQPGNYNVSLKATNGQGCSSTFLRQAYINVNYTKAGFSYLAATLCQPLKITFQNTSQGDGRVLYKWYFGNGDSSVEANPVYTYRTGGTYTVQLKTSNEFGCEDTYSLAVAVANPVTAAFNAGATVACKAPAPIQFNSQAPAGSSYAWSFGDSTFSSVANPLHVYSDTGLYTVKLIVRTSGCFDSVTRTNYIRIQKPFVAFDNLPDSGCSGFSKQINIIDKGTDNIASYAWDFGDGGTSTLARPTHVFSGERYFTIKLIATGVSGCRDTAVMENAVYAGARPRADFTSQLLNVCGQTTVPFTDMTQGRANAWYWSFGDNAQEFGQNPLHRFNDTGYLSVQLIAFNGGCPDTVIKPRYIYIKPSVAKFKFDFSCQNAFAYTFTNLAIGAESWQWDFGDGQTSTERNPSHTYSDTGTYFVSLSTFNNTTGCHGYKVKEVRPTGIHPGFYVSDSVLCKGSEATFTATIDSTEASRFIWYFGDGEREHTAGNTVTHTYRQPGTYTVALVTLNLINCRDSVIKTGYVTVRDAKANFGLSAAVVCANTEVFFTDSSSSAAGIQSWQWNYGDGNTEVRTAPPFSHVYAEAGSYAVSLTVTDNYGCTDTYATSTPLKVRKPYPVFWPSDTLKCTGSDIRFIAPYGVSGVAYHWDFGDGTFASRQMPYHSYSSEGIYSIKLRVSLPEGCADSFQLLNKVKIEDPIAKFNVSDSFRNCPPLIVQFTSESQNALEETWDFGDGTVINAQNPSHFYSYPGTYVAKLTVRGRGGCTRTAQKTIVVQGPTGSLSYGPLNFCQAPAAVTFTAHTTDASSFLWDFNDGTTVNNTDSVVTHQYTHGGQFIPKLMLVDNAGCKVPVQGIETIKFIHLAAGFQQPTGNVCSGTGILFDNTTSSTDSIVSSQWGFGDGFFADNIGSPLHAYHSEGSYYPSLIVRTAGGCVDSFVSASPVVVSLSPDVSINASAANGCSPLLVSFNAMVNSNAVPVSQWHWDFGNGNVSSSQSVPLQHYESAGRYAVQLTATGSNGCKQTISKTVSAYPSPNIQITGSTGICRGGSTTLTASGADAYQWHASSAAVNCIGCSSTVVSPQATTVYKVTGVNEYGCDATDSIEVQVAQPFNLSYSSTAKVCNGSKTQLQTSGADIYVWSPSTGLSSTSSSSPYAQPTVATTYTVIGKDALGCFSDTARISVSIQTPPTVEAGDDKTIMAGATTELIATVSQDAMDITWSPTGNIFRNDGRSITVKPAATTEYTVQVKNAAGCTATDKVKVTVSNEDATGGLFIPNTFSPNGDGANDIFYARGAGNIKINRIKIMNREGVTVFEKYNFYANDVSAGWDGTLRGSRLAIDVYIYAAEVVDASGKTKVVSGNVSLVR